MASLSRGFEQVSPEGEPRLDGDQTHESGAKQQWHAGFEGLGAAHCSDWHSREWASGDPSRPFHRCSLSAVQQSNTLPFILKEEIGERKKKNKPDRDVSCSRTDNRAV